MIVMKMNQDIRKYETKFLGNFTKRETCCGAGILAISIPVATITIPILGIAPGIFISLFLAFPFIACGWLKIGGRPFEQYVVIVLYTLYMVPKNRKFISKNLYHQLFDSFERLDEEEKEKTGRKRNQRNQRKKEKNGEEKVKYSRKVKRY